MTFEFGLQLETDSKLQTYYVKAECSGQAIDYALSLKPKQAFFRTYLPDRCIQNGIVILNASEFVTAA